MALKVNWLFMFACFLLVASRVASDQAEVIKEAPTYPTVKSPPTYAPAPPKKAPGPEKHHHHHHHHHHLPPPVKIPPVHYIAPPVAPPLEHGCVPLCEDRCKSHRKKRPCMKVCTECCKKSKCVPPGTYGNENMCKNWDYVLIHGEKYQCP